MRETRENGMWRRKNLIITALALAMGLSHTFAQNRKPVDASLRVTVVDPNGAAIPKARVSINRQDKALLTNDRGEVNFTNLTQGKYQIQVSAEGFSTRILKEVNVHAITSSVEVRLDVADVKDEVVVGQDKREA